MAQDLNSIIGMPPIASQTSGGSRATDMAGKMEDQVGGKLGQIMADSILRKSAAKQKSEVIKSETKALEVKPTEAPVVTKTPEQIKAEREAFITAQAGTAVEGKATTTSQESGTKGTRSEQSVSTKISPEEAMRMAADDQAMFNKILEGSYKVGSMEESLITSITKAQADMETSYKNFQTQVAESPIRNFLLGAETSDEYQLMAASQQRTQSLLSMLPVINQARSSVFDAISTYQNTTVSNQVKAATVSDTENLSTTAPKSAVGKATAAQFASLMFDMQESGELPKDLPNNFVGSYMEWARTGANDNVFGDGTGALINSRMMSFTTDKVRGSDNAFTDLRGMQQGLTPGTPAYTQASKTLAEVQRRFTLENLVTDGEKMEWAQLKPEERDAKLNEFINTKRQQVEAEGIEPAIASGIYQVSDLGVYGGEAARDRLAGFEDGELMEEVSEAIAQNTTKFSARDYGNYLRSISEEVRSGTEGSPNRRNMAAQQLASMMQMQAKSLDLNGTSIIPKPQGMPFKLKLRDGGSMRAQLDLTNPATWLFYMNSIIPSEDSPFDSFSNFGSLGTGIPTGAE